MRKKKKRNIGMVAMVLNRNSDFTSTDSAQPRERKGQRRTYHPVHQTARSAEQHFMGWTASYHVEFRTRVFASTAYNSCGNAAQNIVVSVVHC